ncbi:MAG: NlpC/P60 family protein, partial [Anaerovoracaceae bacterium]
KLIKIKLVKWAVIISLALFGTVFFITFIVTVYNQISTVLTTQRMQSYSEESLQYYNVVSEELISKGVEYQDHALIIIAIIEVESSGEGKDPMGIAKYTGATIRYPEQSIKAGVNRYITMLKAAENTDINNKKVWVSVQGYHLGKGYAKKAIEYTEANADKYISLKNMSEKYVSYYAQDVKNIYEGIESSSAGSGSGFIYPMKKPLIYSQKFWDHPMNADKAHRGIDLTGSGNKIYASASGRIIEESHHWSYGNCQTIDHGKGIVTLYAHMQDGSIKKKSGTVSQEDQVGMMGSTGNSTGNHLHFEVQKNGDLQDPDKFLAANKPSRVNGTEIVNYAKKFLGNPYVWGGNSLTKGIDCSGYTKEVYKHFGISIPRTTYDQVKAGKEVKKSEIQKGDLVFNSGTRERPEHVTIYYGNGKVIHASDPSSGI